LSFPVANLNTSLAWLRLHIYQLFSNDKVFVILDLRQCIRNECNRHPAAARGSYSKSQTSARNIRRTQVAKVAPYDLSNSTSLSDGGSSFVVRM